ncbi:glycosyltransferase [Paenibacillus sp. IB182496]|uniref:4,4'-diaponeurosporenoate glycosyltransferase n=1 Tax=Paenibacillus sabuli TaxID=2772509 RepID=A0A927GVC7_9BACL|nr:glycosyltransferase [Paenibacillus sabuli]MBD2848612.1 glycosyltransferase [Paenibacillus sabuli]
MPKRRGAKLRKRAGKPSRPIRNAEFPEVSVIIPAMNERRAIAAVIAEAARVHPSTEVIVVANGSTDGTAQAARRMGARVLSYDEALGHDVGRSIGAREAKGRVLLFTDADIVIPARDLQPLVHAVASGGADIALNTYLGPVAKAQVHSVILAKHALNIFAGRADLKGASMTTIPHAISRGARDAIGCDHLAVPPLAQAIALQQGLVVRGIHYVEVGRRNRRRRRGKTKDPLERLIVGDHLEALDWTIDRVGPRGGRADASRSRELVR